jgi:predicted component of type VI protein secretion system
MQSSGSYRLTVRQGPVPGKVFELAKDVMTIGRDVNNDLVINDSEVSRNHARLTSQSGGYLIEDLASTNGTFVNGQRLIGPKLLNSSDVVGLGETIVLEYSYVADSGATVVAAGPIRPMMSAEPPTAPPRTPEPEPMPVPMPEPMPAPMMNEPMNTGANMAPPPPILMAEAPAYAAAPPPPPLPSAVPPKANNNTRNIGIGCGCLLLCICLAAAAYAVNLNLPAIRAALGM